jgi:hypothetical protein
MLVVRAQAKANLNQETAWRQLHDKGETTTGA